MQRGSDLPATEDPLVLAVHNGDLPEVNRLLDSEPEKLSVTGGQHGNQPLLHSAAFEGHVGIVEELLRRGEDINRRSEDGSEALSFAALGGSVEMVEFLRCHGAMHWMPDNTGAYAYDYAKRSSSSGREAILEILGGLREIKDPGFRAGLEAINSGDLPGIRQLLARHPDLATGHIEWDCAYFRRPALFHFIAENPCRTGTVAANACDIAQAFLDAGTPVDITTEGNDPHTLLDLVSSSFPAERCGMLEPLIRLLVAKGADLHHALHVAVGNGEKKATKILLWLGAKPRSLVSAAGLGMSDTVREFLRTDSSFSLKDKEGALVAALNNRQSETAELLIDSGIPLDREIHHGTAIHYAALNGLRGIAGKLIARGASLRMRDCLHHGTPADWARAGGHLQLEQWLREQEDSLN